MSGSSSNTSPAQNEIASTITASTTSPDQTMIDGALVFVPEEDPEAFFARSAGELTSGIFAPLANGDLQDAMDGGFDWDLDLSPVQITGEGISADYSVARERSGESDFLKVGSRGRQSTRRAAVSSGTRISIDAEYCSNWTTEILKKGYFGSEDLDDLVSHCEGNGDPDDLRCNLQGVLETAGLEQMEGSDPYLEGLWDVRSEVCEVDLAEAIEAAFSRSTRRPGTKRFRMYKSDEARLLAPLQHAKQELQLGILSCERAVDVILGAIDNVLSGSWNPETVTMRAVAVSRTEDAQAAALSNANQALRNWNLNGRVMDGRRRREALQALEALDLSLPFHRAVVKALSEYQATAEVAHKLDELLSDFETAVDHLIMEHLPYLRRVSARSVEEGEDPEEVFQAGFEGLQRSTRRFDPEQGHRFVIYCTFWIKNFISRWRANEGAIVRIPVHRQETLAKLDRTIRQFEYDAGISPTASALAIELGVELRLVDMLLKIPRQRCDLDDFDERIATESFPDPDAALDRADAVRVVADLLAELPERHADVVRKRFGIGRDDEMTLDEIGKLYGVTRERIRQIEAKALDRLSHPGRMRALRKECGM